jgi:YbgC/YbaW family acyl-CoA thioester hydrolase
MTETPGFRYTRQVKFYETDLAGVVHFSNYFRYMEEAEHALWRAAGLTVDRAGAELGWPRVNATFDYKRALLFEDEFTIIVRIQAVSARTIQYAFTIVRGDKTIGAGSMTTACAVRDPETMRAVEIPEGIVDRLKAAAGQTR